MCECGARLHTTFGDYTADEGYYLEMACEKCGDPREKEAGSSDNPCHR